MIMQVFADLILYWIKGHITFYNVIRMVFYLNKPLLGQHVVPPRSQELRFFTGPLEI